MSSFKSQTVSAISFLCFCVFVFVAGLIVALQGLFPYPYFEQAKAGFEAWQQAREETSDHPQLNFEVPDFEGTMVTDRYGNPDEGQRFLVVGGPRLLADETYPDGVIAWVMDRDGNVLQRWPWKPEVWENPSHVNGLINENSFYPMCARAFPDGSLLVSYQAFGVFPFAAGLAMFDRDGTLRWKKEDNYHHWFTIGDDGLIYTCAMGLLDEPKPLGDSTLQIEASPENLVYSDVVRVLNRQGEVLDEFNIVDTLAASGYYVGNSMSGFSEWDGMDITHLNFVEALPADMADAYPGLNAGDLLISLRNVSTVFIMDRETREVKWIRTGRFVRQHCARFDGRGHIYVFDNRGGNRKRNMSRIVKLDYSSNQLDVVYPSGEEDVPFAFYNGEEGYYEFSEDGKHLLFALSYRGRAGELDLETGELLWRYTNNHVCDGKLGRFKVSTISYYPAAE
ncbi:MAG: hypothetical protein E1N59_1664 [Puniceicoccaceae bacterium 5H]|nr:MAG: hypothetical protein E1N59_1664 [Puniceicoccaceae bacterium 5H]